LNSGNVIFDGDGQPLEISQKLAMCLEKEFGFDIPILIKTKKEMVAIAEAVPKTWENNTIQRTDIAFLFPEFDSKKIIDELPVKKEFIDVRYVKGALYWNVARENIYKSQLGKLIGHKLYAFMTIRNCNTARYLSK
jgi:uncharacterized protein (DUF1697 family)